jgi:hypothetical protein
LTGAIRLDVAFGCFILPGVRSGSIYIISASEGVIPVLLRRTVERYQNSLVRLTLLAGNCAPRCRPAA